MMDSTAALRQDIGLYLVTLLWVAFKDTSNWWGSYCGKPPTLQAAAANGPEEVLLGSLAPLVQAFG